MVPLSFPDSSYLAGHIYLARQPIFNAALEVLGYELLFRSSTDNVALIEDGNQATSRLIINTFLELGLNALTSNKLAFINLTRDFLTGALPLPFLPEQVVLEILEDISADAESLAGMRALAEQGYTLALDDFILADNNRDFVSFASIIKVDIRVFDVAGLRAQVRTLRQFPVQLLAEKVETQAEFELCRSLGFDLFQGYFFSRPVVISGRELSPNQLTLLEILARLQVPDCNLKELEEVISYDVGISYKLLKIINSSFYGMTRKVDSIQHALVILGLNTLKNWVTVISLSMLNDKPAELITLTLMRARMCEQLAPHFDCKADAAFIVGLFSLLDVLLDQPLPVLLETLPLAEDIVAALLQQQGPLGELVAFVTAYALGEWDTSAGQRVPESVAAGVYLQALRWSDEILMELA